MKSSDWHAFFGLLGKIVNMEGLTADEKARMVVLKAGSYGANGNLEEFVAWFDGDASPDM